MFESKLDTQYKHACIDRLDAAAIVRPDLGDIDASNDVGSSMELDAIQRNSNLAILVCR